MALFRYLGIRTAAARPRRPQERSSPWADAAAGRLRTAAYIVVAAAVVVAALITLASGVRASASDTTDVGCVLAFLLVASAIFTRRRLRVKLADTFGTFALNWLGGYVGGALAVAGLHLKFPVADSFLRSADLSLGIDGVAIVHALVAQGQWIFSLMGPAYNGTIPLLLISMLALALTGKRAEAWRACLCFNGALLTACLITVMAPAKGLAIWFDAPLRQRLPERAGSYAFQTFDRYYYGQSPELGIHTMNGVVTFPSFHMIMGLIVLAMWRKNPLALAAAGAWFAIMLLSTFPLGGHYAVDLIGGAAVWAGWFRLSIRIERGFAKASQRVGRFGKPAPVTVILSRDDALAA